MMDVKELDQIQLQRKLKEANKELQTTKLLLEAANNKISALESSYKFLCEENETLKSESSQWLQRKVEKQRAEIRRLESELNHRSSANEDDPIGHLNEIRALQKREGEYITKISNQICEIHDLNETLNKLRTECKTLKEENTKLQVRTEDAERYVLNLVFGKD